MKVHRGKAIGAVVAIFSAAGVGPAMFSYVFEHGELPVWLSKSLTWMWGVLTTTSVWSVWELTLAVLVIGILVLCLWSFEGKRIKGRDAKISDLNSNLKRIEERCAELQAANEELKHQTKPLVPTKPILSPVQDELLSLVAEFENENAMATLSNLLSYTKLKKLIVISTLDDLIEHGLVQKIRVYIEWKYQLTPAGRKFFMNVS